MIGMDTECMLWWVLCDLLWTNGYSDDNIKEKAMYFIDNFETIDFFDDDKKRWIKLVESLKEKWNQPLPKKKKLYCDNETDLSWNIGDVYALMFKTKASKEQDIYKKYIILQKVGEGEGYTTDKHSIIRIYDKIFDELPSVDEIYKVRILPYAYIEYDLKDGNYPNMEYYVINLSKKDCPWHKLTYLGNSEVDEVKKEANYQYAYYWKNIEYAIIRMINEWRDYDYSFENGECIVTKKTK